MWMTIFQSKENFFSQAIDDETEKKSQTLYFCSYRQSCVTILCNYGQIKNRQMGELANSQTDEPMAKPLIESDIH